MQISYHKYIVLKLIVKIGRSDDVDILALKPNICTTFL